MSHRRGPEGRRRWWGRIAGAAVGLLALAVVVLGIVVGTDSGRQTTISPRDGERLDARPDTVRLDFTAPADPLRSHVTVTDADGEPVVRGGPRFTGATVVVPLAVPSAGTYRVGYHAVFEGGGEESGITTFTVGAGSAGTAADRSVDEPADPSVGEPASGHQHGAIDPLTMAVLGTNAALLIAWSVAALRRRRRSAGQAAVR